ncbi:MAG: AMP-binding protein [Deltaproteobacteria bacterium]|nr:AMP-binding protein [Deltaproteobacteria bacterium]
MGVNDYTVWDFICRNAQIFSDRDSIVFNDVRLTHKQFKECDQAAAGLIKAGVVRGDRLGVVAHNCDEFMILYGAAAKIGAIVLPVNWRFQQDELEYALNDCTPKLAFAGPEYRKTVKEALGKVGSIETCYAMGGGDADADFAPFSDLYSDDGADEEFDVPADAGFVIIHTAAVAGRPRGALLSQGNIVATDYNTMALFNMGPDESHICILPLFHVAGLSLAMTTMHAGGKNVIVERFDPELTLNLIKEEKGTTFFHFAPILSMLLEKYKEGEHDLSSLTHFSGMDGPDNIMAFAKLAPNAKIGRGPRGHPGGNLRPFPRCIPGVLGP